MSTLPESMRWLFWEVEFNDVDADQDVDYILARLLERGRMIPFWKLRRRDRKESQLRRHAISAP